MGRYARHWLKYLNREGLVLLLRDMTLEGDTLKGKLSDTEKSLSDIERKVAEDEAARNEQEAGAQPVMIEEIYGWRPEIDAFGPDEEWNGQSGDPNRAAKANPTEEQAK
jgi:hypothetical protein